jgi:rare lipoprotein A
LNRLQPLDISFPTGFGIGINILLLVALAACAGPSRESGRDHLIGYEERGTASWYGPGFQGHRTANGEQFDLHQLTAAHPTLPMDTLVEVRSLTTGRRVTVRINDRGPFTKGRIIDVSQRAAQALGMIGHGTDEVVLRVIGYHGLTKSGSLRIQVASFTDQEQAQRLAAQLQDYYERVQILMVELPLGRRYRLQVGPFASEAEAALVARELNARFHLDCFIVQDDS